MQLGLSSYTYGWAVGAGMSEIALVERARDFGIGLLQIADNLGFAEFCDSRLDELGRRARGEGVTLELGARRLTPENVRAHLKLCRQLDAHFLRFVADDANFHPAPGDVEATLREIAPELDDITLGLENHDRFGVQTLRMVIENVGDERVGICLDTANSLGAGEGLSEVLEALAPLTVNLHIKDFTIRRVPYLMGFEVEGAPAGSGFVDVAALVRRLNALGRCSSAILELWTPPEKEPGATLEKEARWAAQSVEYLKRPAMDLKFKPDGGR